MVRPKDSVFFIVVIVALHIGIAQVCCQFCFRVHDRSRTNQTIQFAKLQGHCVKLYLPIGYCRVCWCEGYVRYL